MFSTRASIQLSRRASRFPQILAVKSSFRDCRFLSSAPTAASTSTSIPPTDAEIQSAQLYCSNFLKTYDTQSHVLTPFIPRNSRPFYLALRSLSLTLALIPSTTSTPQIAALRLEYWRSAIDSVFQSRPPKEPIAILLASSLRRIPSSSHTIVRTWLHRMLSTRAAHLTNPPLPTLASLESYAEHTQSTLLYLTLASLPLSSLTADHLASHIGKAVGIVATLRSFPLVAFPGPPTAHHTQQPQGVSRQGCVLLPLDVLARHCVSEESILRGGPEATSAAGLRDAVFEVATRANDHLITAREMVQGLRKGEGVGHEFEGEMTEHGEGSRGADHAVERQWEEVRRGWGVLVGPAIGAGLWLEKLQKEGFDVFATGLRGSDWRLPWKAYWGFNRMKF